jgi:hypothetical protein
VWIENRLTYRRSSRLGHVSQKNCVHERKLSLACRSRIAGVL